MELASYSNQPTSVKKKIEELNQLYSEAEMADQDIFAEQRSNVLLVSGDHYTKKGSKFWNRIRDNRELSEQQKLRLTKNHIQKITKTYVNNIVSFAPGVAIVPANETELQDQKAAELNDSVWQQAKNEHKIKRKTREWADNFINIGEVAVKIFWDPSAGPLKGFEAEMNEDSGQPVTDAQGNLVQSNTPVFRGAFQFETVYGFNLLRAPEAKSFSESRVLIIRKMVQTEDLKKKCGGDEDKLRMIQEDRDKTFLVFEGADGGYKMSKGQTLLKEFYFRPCMEYPKGYFYIATESGILWEGELPFGVFPILVGTFEDVPTTPRGRSIIKQLRPYQVEINRAASKMAEHQITLGDDKILIQNGSKVTQSATLPGVRAISYTGMAPTILGGRDGSQYLAYMTGQIQEMYDISNVDLDSQEKDNGQLDPYTLLFRSLKEKKKYSLYSDKFEQFLTDVCETYLELARNYLPEDMLIPAIGKREFVNVAEFKKQDKLGYKIQVQPQSDDIETKMGKQLVMNHILQYVGNSLDKKDIGKLMRNMPWGNVDESFNDLTMDYDNSVNDILALDRGEMPQMNDADDHLYLVQRLVNRMKQADFRFLDPQIQANYQAFKQQHEQADVAQKQAIKAAQADYIPTGGYMVTCDFYVPDPKDPSNTRRARLPYEAVQWLIQRMEQQGSSLQTLEGVQQGAVADMARMMLQNKQSPGQMPQGMGAAPGLQGQASPQGM